MSTDHSWAAVQSLFDALVDLSPQDREARLQSKDIDPATAENVRSLLAASDADGVLDRADVASLIAEQPSTYSSLSAGTAVGPFTIDRLIGRGGMGEVYAAHRSDAGFDQRVALKLLRPEAAARVDLFERERRMLAGLEHPGIARLIDGGIAPDGRPFMAMEYVDGLPIDSWCTANTVDLDTRLRLVREICDAVGYAHARLVIHRDLKPTNILVDETGRVRLLDFGVARLLDETMTTGAPTRALVTPDYAAPEQLGNEASTVATDIYALGAVMYQLLAGRGPWAGTVRSLPSLVRRVMNDDPALPSAVGGGPVAVSRLSGDLDAIVMKAMRRAPDERYRSAAELGDDISRHQRLEPVLAREGSTRYMIGRFMRRYRWAVGASVAALVAVLIGAGGIAWQARQTAIERDIALAEARRSESIVRMLTLMFRDGATGSGEDATVKQMLDQTSKRLVSSLDTSPKSATLIASLFDLYQNLEDNLGADALIAQAQTRGIGKDDAVASAQLQMREASSASATGRIKDPQPLLDAAEAVFRTDPQRFRAELVELTGTRAQLARRAGKTDQAIDLLAVILPQADIVFAENHRDLLTLYNNLLVYMVEANRLDAMVPVFARADAAIIRTGQENSVSALGIEQLKGMRLFKLDQFASAETIFTAVVARRRAVFGKSAGLAADLMQLGRTKLAQGKYEEAVRVLAEARPIAMEKLGSSAIPTLVIGMTYAEALAESGRTSEADRLLEEIAPIITAMPTTGIPAVLLQRARVVVLLKQARAADARAGFGQLEALVAALGPASGPYLKGLATLGARVSAAR